MTAIGRLPNEATTLYNGSCRRIADGREYENRAEVSSRGIESVLGWAFAVLIFWGIPIGFIASDPIVSKNERVLWGFATIFVSWFAWLAFLWIAPIFPKENQYLSDQGRRDGANRRI